MINSRWFRNLQQNAKLRRGKPLVTFSRTKLYWVANNVSFIFFPWNIKIKTLCFPLSLIWELAWNCYDEKHLIYWRTVNNYFSFSADNNGETQHSHYCLKVSLLYLLHCIRLSQVRIVSFIRLHELCYEGFTTASSPIWMIGATPTQIIRNFLSEMGNIRP